MTLVKCGNCGKEVSDTTVECVHCNTPLKKEVKTNSMLPKLLLVISIIGMVIFAIDFLIELVNVIEFLSYNLTFERLMEVINYLFFEYTIFVIILIYMLLNAIMLNKKK